MEAEIEIQIKTDIAIVFVVWCRTRIWITPQIGVVSGERTNQYIHVHIHVHICIYIALHMCTYTHVHTYIHIYT